MSLVMELKAFVPLKYCAKKALFPLAVDMPCRWSVRILDIATRVIVEALKTMVAHKWVPRQDVKDDVMTYIGDTSLLEFVLNRWQITWLEVTLCTGM